MRACVQRVTRGAVRVEGKTIGQIARGLVVLLGVGHDDTQDDVQAMADKLTHLRIFEDDAGKMNLSLLDIGGAMLVVSQFTLYGETAKGRRPSWTAAARPEVAEPLVEAVVAELTGLGLTVATGRFRADMAVELVNDGPITVMVEVPA